MKVSRRSHVPPFAVMEVLAAANARRAAGESVLNLCAGEPSSGASDVVRERAITLLTSGDLAPMLGTATGAMFGLKSQALALMDLESGDGFTAGPTFEYVEPKDRG